MSVKNFITNNIFPLLEKKNFSLIEKLCEEELVKIPDNVELLQYYALSLYENKKINNSINVYKKIILQNDNLLTPYLNIAKIFYLQKNYYQAEEYFQQALKVSNSSYEVLIEIAKFYKNINQNDKCEEKLFQALKKKSKGIEAHILLGEFYYDNKDFLSAINFLLKSDQLDDRVFHVKFLLGLSYLEINNTDKSKKFFLECLSIDENIIEVYQNIIYIFYIRGEIDNANFYIKEAEKKELFNPKIIELKTLINKFKASDTFTQELEKKFTNEENIEYQILYGYSLARIFDYNKNYDLFKKYLDISNSLKRKTFQNYDFKNHLNQFNFLKIFFYENKDKLFNKKNLNKENLSKIPIFIVGMPRSGSTLIDQILSSHSNVYSLGEVEFFSNSVNEVINENNIENFCKKIKSDFSSSYAEKISRLYFNKTKVFEMKNKNYLTDKMLINFKLLPLIKLSFPNCKIIHSYRDAKDNCISILKTNFQHSFMPWAYDQNELVEFYKMYEEVMNTYCKIFEGEILNVKYEDLVLDPNNNINKILNFCDLPFEENCINFFNNTKEVKTASALQVRNKIYKSSLGQWKIYDSCFPDLFEKLN